MSKIIGLVMGDEPLVEQALMERIAAEPAVHAERVIIGGTAERHIGRHHVMFDRISHLVPHYRTYLRAAALAGANVVNDPFAVSDDKFFALSLAARLGANVPRTVLLPQKAYGHGVDPARSLGNLQYPLLWGEIGQHVGFPSVLRPARASTMAAEPVSDVGALLGAFDRTWDSPTMLQAEVPHATMRLRCLCIGGDRGVAFELGTAHNGNGDALASRREEALEPALAISRGLGLEFNAVDVVLTPTQAWVIDAVDPVPHLAPHTLGAATFDEVMDQLAEHLIASTRRPRRTLDAHPWAKQLS